MQENSRKKKTEIAMRLHIDMRFLVPCILLHIKFTEILEHGLKAEFLSG